MKKSGFTFIETLIVIGIIGFLVGSLVIVINPAKRFEQARDRQREIHLERILTAIEQRKITEKGWPEDETKGCKALPEQTTTTPETGKELPIFKIIGTKDDPDYYDLYACLIPKYLDNPLYDPEGGTEQDTHYQIWQNPYTKKVTLRYLKEDKIIIAGPQVYEVIKPPQILTVGADPIFFDRATLHGNVTDDGGSFVFERGFVWCAGSDCEPKDEYGLENYVVVGSGIGEFEFEVLGLSPDTAYRFRAWARNEVDLSWGEIVTFFTDTGKPIVETKPVQDFGGDWAYLCGEIVATGVEDPERWINWGESEAMENNIYFGVGGKGLFCDYLENLTLNTTYYFQAAAQNSIGLSEGEIESFFTQVGKPLVKNTAVNSGTITYYSAEISGSVEKDGGADLLQVGACWSIQGPPDPTQDECAWKDQTALGSFSITIPDAFSDPPNLEPGTLHYVRACAKNAEGFIGCDINYITFTTEKAPQAAPQWINLEDLIYGQDGFVSWAEVETAQDYRLDLYVNDILISEATVITSATSSYLSSQYYQAGDEVQVRVRAEETATHYPSDYIYSSLKTVAKADQEAPLWINLEEPVRYDQGGDVSWAVVDSALSYDLAILVNNATTSQLSVTTTSYHLPGDIFGVGDLVKVRVRASESQNYNPSAYITSAERTVQKGLQDVEIENVTWESLTYEVKATVFAQEDAQFYRIRLQAEGADWSEWQESNIFEGLAPVSTYEFQTFAPETPNYEPATSTIYLSTSPKAYQTIDNIQGVSMTPQICNVKAEILPVEGADDYRARIAGETWSSWQESNIFEGLEGNTNYEFQARKRESALYFEALSEIFATSTPKADQPSPSLSVYNIEANKATVDGGEGAKVSLDQTNWYNSPYTFEGLNCGTQYTAYGFYPETQTHNPSQTTSTTFTTKDIPDIPPPEQTGTPIVCDPPLPSGRQSFEVTSQDVPTITQIIIDPLDVNNGAEQLVIVKIEDQNGNPITSVSGEVFTDNTSLSFDLSLYCGTETDGVWTGTWFNSDTYCQNYKLKITAASLSGTSVVELSFR